MNNSLPRLIDGMVATLREAVLPDLKDDYARGQVFGIIFMLHSIKARASWSNEFLGEQCRALLDLSRELEALAPAAPRPAREDEGLDLPSSAALEARRDDGDAKVCELIAWLERHRAELPHGAAARIEEAVHRYMTRQIKWEIATSAKPMFEEISSGCEKPS